MPSYSVKYDSKFCILIGANPNIKYTKSKILNLLLSQSKKSFTHFEFTGELKEFLQKIHHPGWNGYKRSTIIQMLNSLVSLSDTDLSSKYVIISANRSTVPIIEIEVEL